MKRERQILQEINSWKGDMIRFDATTDQVSLWDEQEAERVVKVPARREGEYRTVRRRTNVLAQTAVYDTFDDLLIGTVDLAARESLTDDKTWSIEEMPDDVQERYEKWCNQEIFPTEDDTRAALSSVAHSVTNRMEATSPCSECPDDAKYACRLSGVSRELYTYPLVRARDRTNGSTYEVPLDAALFVEHHPDALQYGGAPQFSGDGFMSASFRAAIKTDTMSAAYVREATDGVINPSVDMLQVIPSPAALSIMNSVRIGRWQENGINTSTKSLTSAEVALELQNITRQTYAERVTSIDYNEMLKRVRGRLGAYGLALAFQHRYAGMGEVDAMALSLNKDSTIHYRVSTIDMYAALSDLDTQIQSALKEKGE